MKTEHYRIEARLCHPTHPDQISSIQHYDFSSWGTDCFVMPTWAKMLSRHMQKWYWGHYCCLSLPSISVPYFSINNYKIPKYAGNLLAFSLCHVYCVTISASFSHKYLVQNLFLHMSGCNPHGWYECQIKQHVLGGWRRKHSNKHTTLHPFHV